MILSNDCQCYVHQNPYMPADICNNEPILCQVCSPEWYSTLDLFNQCYLLLIRPISILCLQVSASTNTNTNTNTSILGDTVKTETTSKIWLVFNLQIHSTCKYLILKVQHIPLYACLQAIYSAKLESRSA